VLEGLFGEMEGHREVQRWRRDKKRLATGKWFSEMSMPVWFGKREFVAFGLDWLRAWELEQITLAVRGRG